MLIIENKFFIIIYSNYHMLTDIFNNKDSSKAQISNLLDKFTKFDLKIINSLLLDQGIGLVD